MGLQLTALEHHLAQKWEWERWFLSRSRGPGADIPTALDDCTDAVSRVCVC